MRDLMQNYIQEHTNASEAEKLAYAGMVTKLLDAREKAKKAPMIRSLIEQREQELRQMEIKPEQSAANELATDASRMEESALQSVIRKVRAARENAQDVPGAAREAKRSIECDDADYVSALEGEIKRRCRERAAAGRTRPIPTTGRKSAASSCPSRSPPRRRATRGAWIWARTRRP